jgi:hypothetical protein
MKMNGEIQFDIEKRAVVACHTRINPKIPHYDWRAAQHKLPKANDLRNDHKNQHQTRAISKISFMNPSLV